MIFQSKWGFHACDYETYQKLRYLNKITYQNEVELAKQLRWDRKAEWNRKGPRPVIQNDYFSKGSKMYWRLVDAVRADKRNAQYPKEKGAVTPLILTKERIHIMYDEVAKLS